MSESFTEYFPTNPVVANNGVLPDFNSNHENYTRSVARGRNPKSIPRNSELWYHTKNSNDRRDKIAKGHQFWDVVDHTAASSHSGIEGSTRVGTSPANIGGEHFFMNNNHNPNNSPSFSDPRLKDDAQIAIGRKNQNDIKTLNGSSFDVKVRCSLSFFFLAFYSFLFNFKLLVIHSL